MESNGISIIKKLVRALHVSSKALWRLIYGESRRSLVNYNRISDESLGAWTKAKLVADKSMLTPIPS